MNDAAVNEAGTLDPFEHNIIVIMGVNADVADDSEAILQTKIGNTPDRTVGGNTVDCAVRFIINPLAFNFGVCRFISDNENKSF